jgi:hypothetical protein
MRETDQGPQRGRDREVDQVIARAVAPGHFPFAEQSDFRGELTGLAPVVRGRHADGTEMGAPGAMRAIAPRDESPLTRRLSRRPGARLHGVRIGRQATAHARPADAGQRRRCLEGGGPMNTLRSDETPNA